MRRYVARRFPCWRTDVAMLDTDCDLTRCPHNTEKSPGNCAFNDPDRTHPVREIAVLLDLTVPEVERILDQGMRKYRMKIVRKGYDADSLRA